MKQARIIISALRGGAGKTVLSIGVTAALRKRGAAVAPFKKGPDYIDAGWLGLAAGRPCYNLDTFLARKNHVLHSFTTHCTHSDIAVIEGNRGIYDGIDLKGDTSTSELAKLLNTPVILCLDCTKSTRTVAAIVLGCLHFDPEAPIKGVILNRVAGPRHERVLRTNIEHHCNIPVLGAIPKLGEEHFPERHMGLVPTPEHDWANDSIEAAAQMAEAYIDLDRIVAIANQAPDLEAGASGKPASSGRKVAGERDTPPPASLTIGVARDSAFQFYYPDNLEALERAGAEIRYISPLKDTSIPSLDGLYLGGGFPETHAGRLSENREFNAQLKALVEDGLPVYAECGGLMYLGRELILEGTHYPMAGVLPVSFGLSKKPKGHGYTILAVERENPFYPVGAVIHGHEFHYSYATEWKADDADLVFRMKRGTGFHGKRDGVLYKNVLGLYSHVHALGDHAWARAIVRNAAACRTERKGG